MNVTYTAPAIITNINAANARMAASVWSGNGGDNNWFNPNNWEEGKLPDEFSDVLIPANAFPQPSLERDLKIHSLCIEEGAKLLTSANIETAVSNICEESENPGDPIQQRILAQPNFAARSSLEAILIPNPVNNSVRLYISGIAPNDNLEIGLFAANGKLLEVIAGNSEHINSMLSNLAGNLANGLYWLNCKTDSSSTTLKFMVLH